MNAHDTGEIGELAATELDHVCVPQVTPSDRLERVLVARL
jgi:hypothetical protein